MQVNHTQWNSNPENQAGLHRHINEGKMITESRVDGARPVKNAKSNNALHGGKARPLWALSYCRIATTVRTWRRQNDGRDPSAAFLDDFWQGQAPAAVALDVEAAAFQKTYRPNWICPEGLPPSRKQPGKDNLRLLFREAAARNDARQEWNL